MIRLTKIKANVCVVLAATLFAASIVSGCGAKENETAKLRMAYFPNITHTQALVMKAQGTLEEKLGDTCEVTWTSFNAGPAEVEALMAGEIDMGYIGPVPAINVNVKSKGDVKIISNAANAGAVLIGAQDAGLTSVDDLDGRTVAIPQLGNTQHLGLLNLLDENGLSPVSEGGTVNVVAVANADLQALIERKEVDAAFVPEPWASIIQKNCGAQVILDYKEVFLEGEYPTAVVVAHTDFVEKHPDIVRAFLEAHKETTDYINANQQDMMDMVNQEIEAATGKRYEADVIGSAFSRIQVTDELSTYALEEFARIGVEQGFISEEPGDNLINTEIAQ